MESDVISGPWRATRLWNDIIRTFHRGMPLKKHRRHVRTVENCFSGSEAVEWLHKHLKRNPNFGSDVTKEQTTQLLQKFLRAKVIESAEGGDQDAEFSAGSLYRLVAEAAENLRTPGKKSPVKAERRRVFANVGNTPLKSSSNLTDRKKEGPEAERWETKSECSGTQLVKKRSKFSMQMKEDLNRSYFQSLPPNSLIILDNDGTWKTAFVNQLKTNLSEIHVSSLNINVTHIIYNMTKVSAKGIVQLSVDRDQQDLPHWVLSAMKCLANWPKPMRMINGQDSTLPNYPAFINDVFNVVKDYFLDLGSPLIPHELFDIFISAYIKAEAVGARVSCAVPLTRTRNAMQTSTPTLAGNNQRGNFYVMSESVSDDLLLSNYERVAKIRSTQEALPSCHGSTNSPTNRTSSSLEASTSIGSFGFVEDHFPPVALNAEMSKTAIMRNFLPPNSCFETAFMNDSPITRIVLQKECDTLHLQRHRSQSRSSCYTPIQCGWDTRSIATQTSQEDEEERAKARRQPKWKRSSRQRKSIAVMEFPEAKGFENPGFQVSPGNQNVKPRSTSALLKKEGAVKKQFSSLDDLLDSKRSGGEEQFLQKHRKVLTSNDHCPDALGKTKLIADNVILSKAVRKEKKKQREKRDRAFSVDRISNRRASVAGTGYVNLALDLHSPSSTSNSNQQNYYYTSHYNNLTVKTPINAFGNLPDMHYVRAEPYRQGDDRLTAEGIVSAVDSFKLLALLLPPVNRRKLQLLLKFMKRVSTNSQLNLVRDRSNLSLVLDTFTEAILRPMGLSRYDEELCRKIAKFFVFNYDTVWTPPDSLRREVEEKVYQSLVSKRIEAGEDPYPITFCRRVSTKVYNQEKTLGVRNAMQDLLSQILCSVKLNEKEKRKKLKKFKEAYPDIYREKFPTIDDEPEFMTRKNNLSSVGKLSSLTKLRHAMRI